MLAENSYRKELTDDIGLDFKEFNNDILVFEEEHIVFIDLENLNEYAKGFLDKIYLIFRVVLDERQGEFSLSDSNAALGDYTLNV